jgi:hypothetical protein
LCKKPILKKNGLLCFSADASRFTPYGKKVGLDRMMIFDISVPHSLPFGALAQWALADEALAQLAAILERSGPIDKYI